MDDDIDLIRIQRVICGVGLWIFDWAVHRKKVELCIFVVNYELCRLFVIHFCVVVCLCNFV